MEQIAQDAQAQATQEESKDALVVYDRKSQNYGAVTDMDEKTGQFEWEPPKGDYKKRLWEIPGHSWFAEGMKKFCEQYGNPSQIGLKLFRAPIERLEELFDTIIKVHIDEQGTAADRRLLERFELNDEGRIAKLAGKYMFEEKELPLKELAEWGVTPDTMREYKCMGDFMKGRITDTPIPVKKQVNGEWKEMGEACFCATKVDGKIELMVLPVLKKEQFNLAPFDKLFTDDEKQKLATEGHLGGTKVMKDFATGQECECFVSYHAPTKHLTTLPADSIKIPHNIYGQTVIADDWKVLRSGGQIEVDGIRRVNGQIISGTARVDANRRDVCFTTGGDRTLKVGQTINGAAISPEQQKLLEARKMTFVAGMRNPRTGATYSDDVRYSDSNILLVGNAARRYKSQIGQDNSQRTQNRKPRRGVAAIPALKQAGRKQKMA